MCIGSLAGQVAPPRPGCDRQGRPGNQIDCVTRHCVRGLKMLAASRAGGTLRGVPSQCKGSGRTSTVSFESGLLWRRLTDRTGCALAGCDTGIRVGWALITLRVRACRKCPSRAGNARSAGIIVMIELPGRACLACGVQNPHRTVVARTIPGSLELSLGCTDQRPKVLRPGSTCCAAIRELRFPWCVRACTGTSAGLRRAI